jgi:hypothetical protein
MIFADRQDVGLPRDSHFHCGRWMLPGVVVDHIPYTCRAGRMPRASQSGHGSRVGFLLPRPTRRLADYGVGSSDLGMSRGLCPLVSAVRLDDLAT